MSVLSSQDVREGVSHKASVRVAEQAQLSLLSCQLHKELFDQLVTSAFLSLPAMPYRCAEAATLTEEQYYYVVALLR